MVGVGGSNPLAPTNSKIKRLPTPAALYQSCLVPPTNSPAEGCGAGDASESGDSTIPATSRTLQRESRRDTIGTMQFDLDRSISSARQRARFAAGRYVHHDACGRLALRLRSRSCPSREHECRNHDKSNDPHKASPTMLDVPNGRRGVALLPARPSLGTEAIVVRAERISVNQFAYEVTTGRCAMREPFVIARQNARSHSTTASS